MARPSQVSGPGIFIYQCLKGLGPVRSRDTRGTAVTQQIYRNGKGRLVFGGIPVHHGRQLQLTATFGRQRSAHQPTPFPDHKIHHLRCYFFSSADKVSLIFPVFIIHHYNDPAVFNLFYGLFYPIQFHNPD
ncbi:hypothetical protein D9M69_483740 [compost metagenome]